MFMTSCIYFEVPVQDDEDAPNATHVAWRTYITHKPYIYEDVSEDELEINTITFYVENGVWTTEYRNSIDTIKKMVYFDYTFDKPHGTIYIGENEEMFDKKQSIVISVEGMMCPMCEAHVTKALLAVKGVKKVAASHEKKQVEITASASVDTAALKAAIAKAGYKVVDK
jgi:copper chaperone CopZ